jgi:insertion element IS1 protein InsB
LNQLKPDQVEVAITQIDADQELSVEEAELDEMWSFVSSKRNPRWLWHAIDRRSGQVLAYALGRRKDNVFLKLKELLEPFGIKRYCTQGYFILKGCDCEIM